MAERKLSMVKAAAAIGTTPSTLKKFLSGEAVQDGIMVKMRSFTERPDAMKPAKGTASKAKRQSKDGVSKDDLEFVLQVMSITSQERLNSDQLQKLIALRK
jgi:hypothetical protein